MSKRTSLYPAMSLHDGTFHGIDKLELLEALAECDGMSDEVFAEQARRIVLYRDSDEFAGLAQT